MREEACMARESLARPYKQDDHLRLVKPARKRVLFSSASIDDSVLRAHKLLVSKQRVKELGLLLPVKFVSDYLVGLVAYEQLRVEEFGLSDALGVGAAGVYVAASGYALWRAGVHARTLWRG